MGRIEIVITRLSEGEHTYTLEAPGTDIGLSDSFSNNVLVTARLDRRGRQFLLDADVRTRRTFACDRCLQEFEDDVAGTYRTLYVTEGSAAEETGDIEEVRVIAMDAQVLELDDDVRQTLELALPSKVLCREECRGLCPTCGTDLNNGDCSCEKEFIDPRWEPLKQLTRQQRKER